MSIPKGDVRQDISFFVRKIQKVHCNAVTFSVQWKVKVPPH